MKQQSRFTSLILALAMITLGAGSSFAALTAGTSISNVATVSYNEGPPVSSPPVVVTVSLVGGLAWIDTSLTPVTLTVGSGGAVSYTADLQNTGNGTTTVSITDGTTQVAASLGAGTWAIAPNNPTLYGAISNAAATNDGTNTTIPVDYHNVGALTAGDRVMFGATATTVVSWTANTLVVAGVHAIGAGTQIGEIVSVTFSGNAGTLVAPDLDENHLHAMTATDDVGTGVNADGNPAASDTINSDGTNPWYTRVIAGSLTVLKYSRNATSAAGNPAAVADITYAGVDYWLIGVKGTSAYGAATADTLEYLVVISNAGPGDATDVQMTDAISAFLALDTTSIDIDKNGDGDFGDAGETDAIANDGATYAAPNLTVYAGVGGVASTTTGGTITAAAAQSAIRYQAAIQ